MVPDVEEGSRLTHFKMGRWGHHWAIEGQSRREAGSLRSPMGGAGERSKESYYEVADP
jgi:hypothetical protein